VLVEYLAWAGISLWLLVVVSWTIWLVTYPFRQPSTGTHAKAGLEDLGARRKEWKNVRQLWLFGLTIPAALVAGHKDHGVIQWLLVAAMLVIVVWEVRTWLSGNEPGVHVRDWKALGPVVVTGGCQGLILIDGLSGDSYWWVLAVVALVFILAEFEPWFRSWMRRRSDGAAPEPP
jgi:hypothetical protein